MANIPLITFKAGMCDIDTDSKPWKVTPKPTPGYLYLYSEDELTHFCWRPRSAPMTEPTLDLVMVPTDGHFEPYEPNPKTNGRMFVLKFGSSSQRHVFWMQSKSQSPTGDPSWFSPRDLKIGQIVDSILQGEELDVRQELSTVRGGPGNDNDDDDDDDETMEDVEGTGGPHEHHGGGSGASGGAGPGATGGDVREEGESAREGGADGARA